MLSSMPLLEIHEILHGRRDSAAGEGHRSIGGSGGSIFPVIGAADGRRREFRWRQHGAAKFGVFTLFVKISPT